MRNSSRSGTGARRSWVVVAPVAIAVAAFGAGAIAVVACDELPNVPRPTADDGGTTGDGGIPKCSSPPGEFPAPNCDNSSGTCATSSACAIDETKCGSASTCLPLADNSGKTVADFRLRRLNLTAPARLVTLQPIVITPNIDLNAKECGETGKGAFTILLSLDLNKKAITVGGAPPSADPFGLGYCFYKQTVGTLDVAPVVDVPVTLDGLKFTTTPTHKLYIPIFLNGDVNSVVVLPLTSAQLKDVNVSADKNCIGSFNHDALSATCTDDPTSCTKWKTDGSLGGYITLEEADQVYVADLSRSLCSILLGVTPGPDKKCPRNGAGQIDGKGDYCSSPEGPGGCQDSMWLAATFAAAAVKINDGSTVPQCQGGTLVSDAGSDAAPADAAHD